MPGEDVIDVACATGNAALLAAVRGGRVVGIDAAPRLSLVTAPTPGLTARSARR